MEITNESKLIGTEALAKRYDVCERTIANWMREKRIPFIRLSERMVRFDPAEVDAALIRNNRVAARGEAA